MTSRLDQIETKKNIAGPQYVYQRKKGLFWILHSIVWPGGGIKNWQSLLVLMVLWVMLLICVVTFPLGTIGLYLFWVQGEACKMRAHLEKQARQFLDKMGLKHSGLVGDNGTSCYMDLESRKGILFTPDAIRVYDFKDIYGCSFEGNEVVFSMNDLENPVFRMQMNSQNEAKEFFTRCEIMFRQTDWGTSTSDGARNVQKPQTAG
ncbi:hypothetical protein [Azonexus hydrophilus]|uniref:YcxB-like protein domain-containing protein n=1 Tax=Azonexus hydrophilus TaxID=418702 RepID=A0ABZ2XKZ7_9RHOO